MIHRTLAILALPLLAAGCGLELLGAASIQSGLQAENASQLRGTLDYVQQSNDRLGFDQAVNAYRAEHGTYPPSIDAMIRDGYLASAPMQPDGRPYGYDPATGSLTETAPAAAALQAQAGPAITAQDQEALNKLKVGVLDYWTSKRAYPPSLYALVPEFIDQVPATSSGQAFVYDPQAARVYHPSELNAQMNSPATPQQQQQPARRRQRGGAGAGPMGEMMTGIGIQEELSGF